MSSRMRGQQSKLALATARSRLPVPGGDLPSMKLDSSTHRLFEYVVRLLAPVLDEPVFVGESTTDHFPLATEA